MIPRDVLALYAPHDGTLRSMLDTRAAAAGERPFVVFRGATIGWDEAARAVDRVAARYAALGVGRGDRVGVMSRNHPSIPVTFFALAGLGAIMVPVNPDFGVEEARYVFEHAGVCGVLVSDEARPTVEAATSGRSRFLVATEALLDETSLDAPAPPRVGRADDTCVLIYTSGTTGFPKGVMHAQRSVLLAGEGFVERMHLEPNDRLLCVLPMFHINALFYSLGGALAAGATLILEPRFSASSFWRTVAESGATEANTLAAVSSILMRRPRSEYVPGHALRKIYGAPFDAETHRVFREELGVPTLIEGYGMSEVPGVLNNPFEGPHKVGSMGRPSRHPDPTLPFAEMKVVDPADAAIDLPDGETGELLVRTPIVMQGYYRDPEQTAAAFHDGWFVTGDLGYRDADGFFWFVARKKDIIRKRGENIAGAELDRVIGAHPAVVEAAAIAVPDELGEDEILVAVVAREPVTAESIAAFCRERLAPIKVPRYVAFVDALPKTATHRVEKFRLRADADLRRRAVDLRPPR